MNESLIEIPEANIQMSFYIENQEYVIFSDTEELNEGDEIYFAKKDYLDNGNSIIRNIENDEEYNKVVAKYEEIINKMEEEDE